MANSAPNTWSRLSSYGKLEASNIDTTTSRAQPTERIFFFQGSDFSWVATVKSVWGGSQVYAISDVHFDHKCNEDGAVFEPLENRRHSLPETNSQLNHQEFQVPKMEVLNLIRLFLRVSFPLHKPYIQLI